VETATKELMNLVILGHVDHGKSTLIGRLLVDTSSLPEGKLERIRRFCRRTARPFEYAFLLDALKDEQAQGVTIDTARCFFETGKRRYLINDAPGHVEFLKNMVTGAARAEAALLIIDAREGVQENSKRHGYMASMLGVKEFSVIINKMDLVGYNEKVFSEVRDVYSEFLGRLGLRPVSVIPVSAREGVNIAGPSDRTPWYSGPSVLEQIDSFEKPPRAEKVPFRMPVQGIYKFTGQGDSRRIVAGTVESGTISVGDAVLFLPSGKRARVETIESFNGDAPETVSAGAAAGFTLTKELYIKPGELACRVGEPQPIVGTRFRANLFWMGRAPMIRGKRYKLKLAAARVPVELVEVNTVIDASELSTIQGKRQIDRHDVADCVLETLRPVAYDLHERMERTGRFVVVDGYEISGCGIVLQSVAAPVTLLDEHIKNREYRWDKGLVRTCDRAARYGHYGKFILFIGPPDTGRRLVAKGVEKTLFERGCRTYYLGVETIFHEVERGIQNDLMSREAHLRLLGELARVMADSGLLFIATLSDVDDFDLEVLRKLNQPNELFVVSIGETPVSTFPIDVKLPENPGLKEAVKKIAEELTSRNVLIEYYI